MPFLFTGVRCKTQPGNEFPVQLSHPGRAKKDQFLPKTVCGRNELRKCYPLANRRYPTQIPGSPFQQADGTAEIPVPPVVEGHRNLQDTLVEMAGLPLCTDPEVFKGFVALEPVTPVEFPHGPQ